MSLSPAFANPEIGAPRERLRTPLLLALAVLGRAHVLFAPDALVLGWRQADVLAVARAFTRHGYRLFWPQVDWGGAGPGYVEMELPVLPWIGALFQSVLGPQAVLTAVVPLLSSVGLVFAIAAVTHRIFGPAAGFWAGAFAALSPMTAWYTATAIPDGTMLFASVLGVLFLVRFVEADRRSDLVLSGAFTSLAVLLKPTSLLAGLPLLFLFALKWGRSLVSRPVFWIYGAGVLAPPLLWYVHAHGLYVAYGNTFGVLGGGYGKLSTFALLARPEFWLRIASRTVVYLLTPGVAVLAAFGLARRPAAGLERLFHVWAAAALVYVLVVGRGNFEMQHYQLPLLPPAAALAGAAFAGFRRRAANGGVPRAARFAVSLVLVVGTAGAILVHARRVVAATLADARRQRANGQDVAAVTPPGSLILVTTGYGGSRRPGEIDTPPEIFFHADRRGWFVGLHWLTPEVVAARRAEGARFLVVSGEALPFFTGPEADALRTLYASCATGPDVLVLDLAGAPEPRAAVRTRAATPPSG